MTELRHASRMINNASVSLNMKELNSTVLSPAMESNSLPTISEILCFLWNSTFITVYLKSPLLRHVSSLQPEFLPPIILSFHLRLIRFVVFYVAQTHTKSKSTRICRRFYLCYMPRPSLFP
jgi:hypothetical protein